MQADAVLLQKGGMKLMGISWYAWKTYEADLLTKRLEFLIRMSSWINLGGRISEHWTTNGRRQWISAHHSKASLSLFFRAERKMAAASILLCYAMLSTTKSQQYIIILGQIFCSRGRPLENCRGRPVEFTGRPVKSTGRPLEFSRGRPLEQKIWPISCQNWNVS